MSNSTIEILEFRCVILPEFTKLYICSTPTSDHMLGVGGWYVKTVGKDEAALPILEKALRSMDYLTEWERGIPTDKNEVKR